MEDQTHNQQPTDHTATDSDGDIPPETASVTGADEEEERITPLDFYAEMRVHAMDPVTGAKVELGYEHEDEWVPVRFYEGPSLFCYRDQLEYWLTQPDTLLSFDGTIDLEYSQQCVEETIQRCFRLVKEILDGTRSLPEHPIDVWPVNGQVWTVQPGERIPPGITHIRQHDSLRVCQWCQVRPTEPKQSST